MMFWLYLVRNDEFHNDMVGTPSRFIINNYFIIYRLMWRDFRN